MIKVLTLFFLLTATLAYGQAISQQEEFLDSYFSDKEPLYYTDAPHPKAIDKIKQQLASDTLYAKVGYLDKLDTLILNKEERLIVDSTLKCNFLKANNILKRSRLIPREEINEIFRENVFYGWQKLREKHGIVKYYSFTHPILLRNDTVCIYYSDYSCGSLCGEGELVIYKKENGSWKRWMALLNWVS